MTMGDTATFFQEENGKYIRFYIKDTGKGIPKDQQGVIFHRFHKLDSYIKGNGLGLPICESMIRTLGGNIGVISEEGVGSEFWFTVPTKAVPT